MAHRCQFRFPLGKLPVAVAKGFAMPISSSGVCFALAMIAVLSTKQATACYPIPIVERVPVDRLIDNLNKQASARPKDAVLRLNVARVHAMAYALKASELEVEKGLEDKAPSFAGDF